jgi:hypothetical protein
MLEEIGVDGTIKDGTSRQYMIIRVGTIPDDARSCKIMLRIPLVGFPGFTYGFG